MNWRLRKTFIWFLWRHVMSHAYSHTYFPLFSYNVKYMQEKVLYFKYFIFCHEIFDEWMMLESKSQVSM